MEHYKALEYKNEAWQALLNRTFNNVAKLAIYKGHEYSGDVDRLANFRRNALALGLLKEQVWAVYAGKRWDAISQYVKDLASGESRSLKVIEPIIGRAEDLIVYLLLFLAMEEERSIHGVAAQRDKPKSMLYPYPPEPHQPV